MGGLLRVFAHSIHQFLTITLSMLLVCARESWGREREEGECGTRGTYSMHSHALTGPRILRAIPHARRPRASITGHSSLHTESQASGREAGNGLSLCLPFFFSARLPAPCFGSRSLTHGGTEGVRRSTAFFHPHHRQGRDMPHAVAFDRASHMFTSRELHLPQCARERSTMAISANAPHHQCALHRIAPDRVRVGHLTVGTSPSGGHLTSSRAPRPRCAFHRSRRIF